MGLVPVADGHAYYASPVEELLTGHWNSFASRRPFAAGFRQLLMTAGGFSNLETLLLQTMLIAAAVFLAVRSIILWRGLWSGIAFGALIYVVARPFLSSMLTEPLGLFWALLAVAFTAETMRLKSLAHAWLALTAFTFAEIIRMGSMFTIPAFVLWIAMAFGTDLRNRLKLAAAGGALVALVMIIQSTIAAMYGSPEGTTGANFAFTLCGLALGQDWNSCSRLFASELQHLPTDGQQAAFLTAKAFEMIGQSPSPMLGRMLANVRDLVTGIPEFFLYGRSYHRPLQEILFIAGMAPGLWLAWQNREKGEASFWALLFISVTGSAALIFADDGWRTTHVTWPFIALFFSIGFVSPMAMRPAPGKPLVSRWAGVSLIAILVGLTVAAPAAGRIWPGGEFMRLSEAPRAQTGQSAILAGPTVTGFLVIPDGARLPPRLSAIRRSDFIRLANDRALERDYGPFMDFMSMQTTFAVITAARIDGIADWPEYFFVAPPEILTRGSAPAWRVEIGRRTRDSRGNDQVLELTSVQPLEAVRQAAPQ